MASYDIKPGKNQLTLQVSPTIDEVASRYSKVFLQQDWGLTYELLHPDAEDKKIGKGKYIDQGANDMKKLQEQGAFVKNFVNHKALMLNTWKHPKSGKMYSNVARVPFTVTVGSPELAIFGMGEITQNLSGYFQKVGGEWKLLIME